MLIPSTQSKNSLVTRYGYTLERQAVESARVLKALNEEQGAAFLQENQSREGVLTTESGLQYQILEEGEGPSPTVDDWVVAHYRGTLLNGEEFDSSYARGNPAVFPVSHLIAGWVEALQGMKTGAEWMLFVPPDLAYGEEGSGPLIGPNETLIFDIHLLGIVPQDTDIL